MDALERAVALNPGLPDTHVYLGSALAATPRQKDARAAAYRALGINPDSVDALALAAK